MTSHDARRDLSTCSQPLRVRARATVFTLQSALFARMEMNRPPRAMLFMYPHRRRWVAVSADSGEYGGVVRQATATEAAAIPLQRDVDVRPLLRRPDALLRRRLPRCGGGGRRHRRRQTDDVHQRPAAEQGPPGRLVRHTLLDVQQTRTV